MIQGFDSSFEFIGSKTNIEQAIGNAVPVDLAQMLGRALLEYKRDFEAGVALASTGQCRMLIR